MSSLDRMTSPEELGFRAFPPFVADERTMYQSWLDFHRGTLLWKCEGLTDEQLKTPSTEPSKLTLLGLLRHMTEVEQGWFRDGWDDVSFDRGADGTSGWVYSRSDWQDADFEDLEGATFAEAKAAFQREVGAADAAAEGRSLDDTKPSRRSGQPISLRWIYVHMIEEYARHNGHADLIRERIDGQTGD